MASSRTHVFLSHVTAVLSRGRGTWGRYDSCHGHLLPCLCSVNITPLQEEDDKGTWRAVPLPSSCCCGPEGHTLILHPVSSKNKYLSSSAGTQSMSVQFPLFAFCCVLHLFLMAWKMGKLSLDALNGFNSLYTWLI